MKRHEGFSLWLAISFLVTLTQSQTAEETNIFSVLKQMTANDSVANSSSTVDQSVMDVENNNDYIVKISFTLNERTIIPFLRDEIFYRYDTHNITTTDVIQLYNLENLTLNGTWEVLQKLNVSNDVLNVNNFRRLLEFSNITFNDFFEKLKETTNLSGSTLSDALQILNINLANFSQALALGVPNVYDVLNMGIYNVANFEQAAKTVDTNLPTFYENAKAIILNQIKLNSIGYYAQKLRTNVFLDKMIYDKIWNVYNFNVQDIYRVPKLKSIVDNIFERLNENTILAVVISDHEIISHQKLNQTLGMNRKIVNINAHSIRSFNIISDSLVPMTGRTDQSMILWSNNTIESKIEVAANFMQKIPQNCTYVYPVNSTFFIEQPVDVVELNRDNITVRRESSSELKPGSPLICEGKVFGLASENHEVENAIVFSTLFSKSDNVPTINSGNVNIFHLYMHMIPLMFIFLF